VACGLLRAAAGLPSLQQVQDYTKQAKRAKTAGIQVETVHELRQWAYGHALPHRKEDLEPHKVYAVPIDYSSFPNIEAICLTSDRQIGWIMQLNRCPVYYVFHIDGKHKLHHGKWMLITIGVHVLALSLKKQIVHQFRPLVYQFVKQQESALGSAMLCTAVNTVSTMYGGQPLLPAVLTSDRSTGFRSGCLSVWSNAGWANCWPHLCTKLESGKAGVSKSHPMFEKLCGQFRSLRAAQSVAMFQRMVHELGKLPGWKDNKFNTLWNSYLLADEGWDHWFLGAFPKVPACIQNNNVIEIWHEHGVMNVLRNISGAMKGSTEFVLEHTMSALLTLDGVRMPELLNFSVPVEWIPVGVYEAARKIVLDPRRIRIVGTSLGLEDNRAAGLTIYVLSNHCTKFNKIDDSLIAKYEAALRGERPARVKSWDSYISICSSVYKLEVAADIKSLIPCRANFYKLLCPCYSGRHRGICSHIAGATHTLMRRFLEDRNLEFNVKYRLMRLCAPRRAHRPRKPRGARVVEDSSDEEEDEQARQEEEARSW